jgi:hypothetical protein
MLPHLSCTKIKMQVDRTVVYFISDCKYAMTQQHLVKYILFSSYIFQALLFIFVTEERKLMRNRNKLCCTFNQGGVQLYISDI